MDDGAGIEDDDRTLPSGALARGLRVLVALNDLETATISGLVAETRLPKPTMIRLLQALVSEGYVAHSADTSTYRITTRVASLSRALVGRNISGGLVQAALDDLADRLKWPTEFLTPDGTSMVVTSNNRERAPIRLKLFERRRFPMAESAAGIVHLAALPSADRAALLARIDPPPQEVPRIAAWIARAQADGHATRELRELAPHMRVAAIAIPQGGGALSLVYFDDVVTERQLADVLLPALRTATDRIAGALRGEVG